MNDDLNLISALESRWVVLLEDPDGGDTSPWSVVAPDVQTAIATAKADWLEWLAELEMTETERPPWPRVVKVYAGSWISRRSDV